MGVKAWVVAGAVAMMVGQAMTGQVWARPVWSAEQANAWYTHQGWPVGSNFIPKDAINQLEMWQADTFDAHEIDWELGLAERTGMTTMRVFLHDQLWTQDPAGFKARIDTFLTIAARHHIKPLFVLFDSCWDPNPKLGKQHDPVPGVHNSGWVQSPGTERLRDMSVRPELEAYVKGVVGAYARDDRILGWDVWNEPQETVAGTTLVADLLPQVFVWARSVEPSQPLTSGLFTGGDWSPAHEGALSTIERVQIDQSDIISFHNYGWPEDFEGRVTSLVGYGRPIFCTEYMARGAGSTIDNSLPIGKAYHVAMYNWGFVDGKTQTRFPWDSGEHPYVTHEPTVWFHDLYHKDGTPYRQHEIDMIRDLTGYKAE